MMFYLFYKAIFIIENHNQHADNINTQPSYTTRRRGDINKKRTKYELNRDEKENKNLEKRIERPKNIIQWKGKQSKRQVEEDHLTEMVINSPIYMCIYMYIYSQLHIVPSTNVNKLLTSYYDA